MSEYKRLSGRPGTTLYPLLLSATKDGHTVERHALGVRDAEGGWRFCDPASGNTYGVAEYRAKVLAYDTKRDLKPGEGGDLRPQAAVTANLGHVGPTHGAQEPEGARHRTGDSSSRQVAHRALSAYQAPSAEAAPRIEGVSPSTAAAGRRAIRSYGQGQAADAILGQVGQALKTTFAGRDPEATFKAIVALMAQESGFNPRARSSSGSCAGLMQINLAAHPHFARDQRWDSIPDSVREGSSILEGALKRHSGDLRRAINSYGTGWSHFSPRYRSLWGTNPPHSL
jgi:hypothetical protein